MSHLTGGKQMSVLAGEEGGGSRRLGERLLSFLDFPNRTELLDTPAEVFLARLNCATMRNAFAMVALLALLFWPTDFFVFHEDPESLSLFFWWRLSMVIAGIVAFFFLRRLQGAGDDPLQAGVLFYYVMSGFCAYLVGALDTVEASRYLMVVIAVPLISLAILVPLRTRVWIVGSVSGLVMAIYLLVLPDALRQEYFAVSGILLLSFALGSVGVGHVIYLLMASNIRAQKELHRIGTIDSLTGLPNRRAFFQQAQKEMTRAQRHGRALCVVMIDIDHFKSVNDTWGHATGDLVLKQVAGAIAGLLRTGDVVGRIGGEEFALMLPETPLKGGLEAAERIRQQVAALEFDLEGLSVTTSLGCANLEVEVSSFEALLQRADEALYQAKTGGRNRVVAHEAGRSPEVRSSEVRSSEVGSSEVRSSEVGSSEVRSSEVRSPEVRS